VARSCVNTQSSNLKASCPGTGRQALYAVQEHQQACACSYPANPANTTLFAASVHVHLLAAADVHHCYLI
jgi:hypothetical protein